MKVLNLWFCFMAACLVVLSGCGNKQPQPLASAALDISGVQVDMPKLKAAVATNPQLQAAVNAAALQIRYGKHLEAMQSVSKLAANPALSDAQKKIVTDVVEQLKQVVAKAGPVRQ